MFNILRSLYLALDLTFSNVPNSVYLGYVINVCEFIQKRQINPFIISFHYCKFAWIRTFLKTYKQFRSVVN